MLTFYHGIGHGGVEGCELHINIEGLVHVSSQAGDEAGSIVTGADCRTAEVGDPVVEEGVGTGLRGWVRHRNRLYVPTCPTYDRK